MSKIRPKLIMPMAGRGSRFLNSRELTPKPLIQILNKPFFWWAAYSAIKAFNVERIIFVIRREHCINFKLDKIIKYYFESAEVVILESETSGAAETALLATEHLGGGESILVNDCDHAFVVNPDVDLSLDSCDASLLLFNSSSPNYSYALTGHGGNVLDVAEKKVISNNAIAGCYYFRNCHDFRSVCSEYLIDFDGVEPYMSGVIGRMISSKMIIKSSLSQAHWAFGTPEELSDFNSSKVHQFINIFLDGRFD